MTLLLLKFNSLYSTLDSKPSNPNPQGSRIELLSKPSTLKAKAQTLNRSLSKPSTLKSLSRQNPKEAKTLNPKNPWRLCCDHLLVQTQTDEARRILVASSPRRQGCMLGTRTFFRV